jgi:ribose 5-phosphate isomerase B
VKVAIASDHAGFELKEIVKKYLLDHGHEVRDFGTNSLQSVDYPDFVYPAALAVMKRECDRAVLIDGAGYPSAAIANKLFGVTAAVCNDAVSARLSREHSDANVLCLGGKIIGSAVALEVLRIWLDAQFLGGRYATRLEKVRTIERRHLRPPDEQPLRVLALEDIKASIVNKMPLLITKETIVTPSVLELAQTL